MTYTDEHVTARQEFLDKEKITVKSVFVPFSQSRNKDNKDLSLNWKVTVLRNDREVLTTDYMQGIGHAPSHKNPPKFSTGKINKYLQRQAESMEAESGKVANPMEQSCYQGKTAVKPPSRDDVLYALISDSSVLDYSDYEEWADNFGYEPDSRKGEKIYKSCMKIALKMRSGLGNSTLEHLQGLFSEY